MGSERCRYILSQPFHGSFVVTVNSKGKMNLLHKKERKKKSWVGAYSQFKYFCVQKKKESMILQKFFYISFFFTDLQAGREKKNMHCPKLLSFKDMYVGKFEEFLTNEFALIFENYSLTEIQKQTI
jgi:hypothetical protein